MTRGPRSRAWASVVDITALQTYCWCEARVVFVPVAEVKAGQTRSCGARDCNAPEAA